MKPLAHRGFWLHGDEPNSLAAFRAAFRRGWGVELDVRDCDGALVISHDPPTADAPRLDEVVAAYVAEGAPGALAVNVKADGLDAMIAGEVPEQLDWFAFDMSVPDALRYLRAGLPAFTRHSDIEPAPSSYEQAGGVWLDDFGGGWIDEATIAAHLEAGKRVAVVSPELHGRDRAAVWADWKRWEVWRSEHVLLCTDHPDEAEEVFA